MQKWVRKAESGAEKWKVCQKSRKGLKKSKNRSDKQNGSEKQKVGQKSRKWVRKAESGSENINIISLLFQLSWAEKSLTKLRLFDIYQIQFKIFYRYCISLSDTVYFACLTFNIVNLYF